MPDPKNKPDEQDDVQPTPVTLESITAPRPGERPPTKTEQQQQAISRLALEAAALKKDETVPGGRYLQDGILVDAFGVPLKDQS